MDQPRTPIRFRRWLGVVPLVAAVALPGCSEPGSAPRFLAASSAAVYESTDGGEHWAPTAGQPGAGSSRYQVTDITFTGALDIAAGEMDRKATVFVSPDEGHTWAPAPGRVNPPDEAISVFSAVECRGKRCAAAGFHMTTSSFLGMPGPVAISDDGGATWRRVADVPALTSRSQWLSGVAVGGDGTVVVTAGANGPLSDSPTEAYLYRSSDGGASWETWRVPSVAPESAVVSGVHEIGGTWVATGTVGDSAAGARSLGLVSTDGAHSWDPSAVSPASPQGWTTSAANDTRVAALSRRGGALELWVTADQGASWHQLPAQPPAVTPYPVPPHPPVGDTPMGYPIEILAYRGTTLVIASQLPDPAGPGVVLSTDDGATWHPAATPPPGNPALLAVSGIAP
jgi:photosystem II stability/assembly factor-like uncharacterized protein